MREFVQSEKQSQHKDITDYQQLDVCGINVESGQVISHLAVHKNFQRRHVRTALLNFIFEMVPNFESLAGCRYILLNPRDDEGVGNFYTNYGFRCYSNFKGDTESDAFLMDLKFFNIHNSKD